MGKLDSDNALKKRTSISLLRTHSSFLHIVLYGDTHHKGLRACLGEGMIETGDSNSVVAL